MGPGHRLLGEETHMRKQEELYWSKLWPMAHPKKLAHPSHEEHRVSETAELLTQSETGKPQWWCQDCSSYTKQHLHSHMCFEARSKSHHRPTWKRTHSWLRLTLSTPALQPSLSFLAHTAHKVQLIFPPISEPSHQASFWSTQSLGPFHHPP